MAHTAAVSLDEYMATSYRPDCEWIDGDVRERNLGKYEHARLQALLTQWFANHEAEWQVEVVTEQRVQVAPQRVRIPDVAVLKPGPHPPVLIEPFWLAIEILSPEDSDAETQQRASDFLSMGVRSVWIIDPKTRIGRMASYRDSSDYEAWSVNRMLMVEGTPIYVDLDALFLKLGLAAG